MYTSTPDVQKTLSHILFQIMHPSKLTKCVHRKAAASSYCLYYETSPPLKLPQIPHFRRDTCWISYVAFKSRQPVMEHTHTHSIRRLVNKKQLNLWPWHRPLNDPNAIGILKCMGIWKLFFTKAKFSVTGSQMLLNVIFNSALQGFGLRGLELKHSDPTFCF